MLLIPISTENRIRKPPWVNYGLIATNVLAFVLLDRAGGHSPQGAALANSLMLWAESPQWYQFITSMFLHADWIHLIGNMIFLWVFGNSLNNKLGHPVYLLFYLGSGLFAGAGYVLFRSMPVVGASGAVFGVTAGFLVLFPLVRVTTLFIFFFITFLDFSGMVIVGYFIAYNAFYLLIGAETGVAYLAHLAGAFFGFSAAMLLLASGSIGRDQFDFLALLRRWRARAGYRAHMSDPDRQAQARYGRMARPVDPRTPTGEPLPDRISELRMAIAQALDGGDARSAGRAYAELLELDPEQCLPARRQQDLGSYLMSDGHYELAARAYEALLARYPTWEQAEQVELLLGLLHRRYLDNPVRARHYLERCRDRLRDPHQQQLCREELALAEQALGGG